MPAIGSVNVKISASTLGLTSGLGVASKAIKSFGSGVTGLAAKLGPLAVAAAGVAGVAGFGSMLKSSLDTLDANAKLGDALGLTQEQLVGYQHAAELSGVSSETLESSLGKLTRKGISLETLADKMAEIQDPTERAKLAFDVLGKSGQEMIPLLSAGGAAIRDMMADGANLHGVFGAEDIAGIEAANDAISRVGAAFTGIFNSVAVVAAPVIQTIADRVTDFGVLCRDTFESLVPVVTEWIHLVSMEFEFIGTVASDAFNFISGSAGISFTSVKDFILDTLIGAEFVFKNFGTVAGLVWDKVKLGAVAAFMDIGHFFTAVIPGWLTWFSNNWSDVFFTAFDLASTVFINLGQNIRNLFSNLWEWMKTGFQGAFKFDWTDLQKGAVNAIKSMPDIPARAMTEIEKTLTGSINATEDKLGADFKAFKAERLAALTEGSPAGLKSKLKIASMGDDDEENDPALKLKKGIGSLEAPSAVGRNSSEAFSAIFGSQRASADQKATDTLKAANQQIKIQIAQQKLLEKIAKHPSVELVAGDL